MCSLFSRIISATRLVGGGLCARAGACNFCRTSLTNSYWFDGFDGIIIYLLPDGLQRRLEVWVASQYHCCQRRRIALATVKPSLGCPMLRSESSMSNCRLLMPSASPTLLARVISKPLRVRIMPNASRIALSSSTTRIVGRLPLVVILLQIRSLPADPVKLHQRLAMQFQRDVFEPESWFDQPLLHIRDFCRAPKQHRGSVLLCWRCQVSRKSETDGS